MADESGWKEGTEVTLEESGVSLVDGGFTEANDAIWDADVDNLISTGIHGTHLKLVLSTVDMTANAAVGSVINIYAQPQNFEGTEDGEPPSPNYPHTFVAAMPIDDNNIVTQDILKDIVRNPFPHNDIKFFIEAQTVVTISAGWNLRVTPKYFAPGA